MNSGVRRRAVDGGRIERVIGNGTSSNGFAKRRMRRAVGVSEDKDGIGGTMVTFGTTSLLDCDESIGRGPIKQPSLKPTSQHSAIETWGSQLSALAE